jgi:hypothetical protein
MQDFQFPSPDAFHSGRASKIVISRYRRDWSKICENSLFASVVRFELLTLATR